MEEWSGGGEEEKETRKGEMERKRYEIPIPLPTFTCHLSPLETLFLSLFSSFPVGGSGL